MSELRKETASYPLNKKTYKFPKFPFSNGKVLFYLFLVISVYGLPVYAAYMLASAIEPVFEGAIIEPLEQVFSHTPYLIEQVLVGDFGLFTLGMYSFLWAFPVVLFVGMSIAFTEEVGLKDKITSEITPSLRRIGLSGRDFIPVLTGYGCNVVAVLQTKSCSACTRKQCISMISFGSACSYQIGATLSIFSVGGKPWLFIPYLFVLIIVGALHTKLWYPSANKAADYFYPATPINTGSLKQFFGKIKGTVSQFFLQAMPIFLVICIIAAILDGLGLIAKLSQMVEPVLSLLSIPAAASVGLLFSVIRKDGMLLFNQGGGELLASITTVELFLLVYLASTLSACLVTMWAIGKEMGFLYALKHSSKQALTSIISAFSLLIIYKAIIFFF
ncbi:nucleoside recognition domain-containing protein [Alkalihalobacterium chitinilyticum]|uniref:Ferrous iron transporter B n=1 Tax=Alkalihalobacterium chitinilyticum TaxID=2980103 RepID=A0ABT5V9T0_9BACI|nr:nucleoside recognition domain-containing protein [Alkalihalobacterium chitinilyticum]MDE5412097.1 ferrous iron transporter B [Alkalihalobacterium chitinilyticum]